MSFDVTVRTLTGKNYIIAVKPGETVGDLRQKIANLVGTAEFRIIYSGKNMQDDHVFADNNRPCENFHIIFFTKSTANIMVKTSCVLGAVVVGAVVLVLVGKQLTRKRVS